MKAARIKGLRKYTLYKNVFSGADLESRSSPENYRENTLVFYLYDCRNLKLKEIFISYKNQKVTMPENIRYLLVFCSLLFIHQNYGLQCLPKCQCIWRKGKPSAECSAAGFEKIPDGLDTNIQVLDIKLNNLTLLPPNAFLNVGLVHLQRVYMQKCGIHQIDDFALNRISNLVELDLSDNLIATVPTAAFRHLPLLRHLILNGNPLTVIPSQAFGELKTLIILELSNCKIDTIVSKAFETLEKLEVLKLDSNELQTLHAKTMVHMKALHGITLDGNPWTCDCELRGLRQWLDTNNVPYIPPVCCKPPRLRDKIWSDVDLDDYACAPTFLNTSSAMNVFESSNVTLDCKVAGDPIPTVQWQWRERIIANLSEGISSMQSFLISEYSDKEKISRLKISSVQEPNAGIYACVAENTAGKVVKNFTLMVSRMPVTGVKIIEEEKTQEVKDEDEDKGGSIAGMAIGVVAGAIIVIVLLSSVFWLCHRKRQRREDQRKRDEENHKICNSNASASKGAQEDTEQKMINLNPINKGSHLGIYEGLPNNDLDHYDPVMIDSTVTAQVWMVQDHLSHADIDWDGDPNVPQCIITSQVLMEKRSRSPIPIPMPIPLEDIHVRLHNELSDSLRKKCDKRAVDQERERGDGSSEMHVLDSENMKISFEPHLLTTREEERRNNAAVSVFLPEKCSDEKGPDLIDHARRDVIPEEDEEEWKNSPPQSWIFEPATTYYRQPATQMKSITATRMPVKEGESTATEV